jgi:hypothetical protein
MGGWRGGGGGRQTCELREGEGEWGMPRRAPRSRRLSPAPRRRGRRRGRSRWGRTWRRACRGRTPGGLRTAATSPRPRTPSPRTAPTPPPPSPQTTGGPPGAGGTAGRRRPSRPGRRRGTSWTGRTRMQSSSGTHGPAGRGRRDGAAAVSGRQSAIQKGGRAKTLSHPFGRGKGAAADDQSRGGGRHTRAKDAKHSGRMHRQLRQHFPHTVAGAGVVDGRAPPSRALSFFVRTCGGSPSAPPIQLPSLTRPSPNPPPLCFAARRRPTPPSAVTWRAAPRRRGP